jgi:hypothetical protein
MQHLILTLFFLIASSLHAAISIHAFSGVMLQPNSQYFHGAYGATITALHQEHHLLASLTYAQRPKFTANGFADQEQGLFLTAGKEFPLSSAFACQASAGIGEQKGYLEDLHTHERREYSLRGIAAKGDIFYRFKTFALGLSHISFVGIDGKEQLTSYVAWPYSYFQLSLGVAI